MNPSFSDVELAARRPNGEKRPRASARANMLAQTRAFPSSSQLHSMLPFRVGLSGRGRSLGWRIAAETAAAAIAGRAVLATPLSVAQLTPEDRRLCVPALRRVCLFQTGRVVAQSVRSGNDGELRKCGALNSSACRPSVLKCMAAGIGTLRHVGGMPVIETVENNLTSMWPDHGASLMQLNDFTSIV